MRFFLLYLSCMKHSIFTVFTFLTLNIFSQSTIDSTYYETFKNANGWDIINKDDASSQLSDGFLIEYKSTKGSHTFWKKVTLDLSKDFSYEIAMSIVTYSGAPGYGLIWGMTDWDDYNSFLISPGGYYKIAKTVAKQSTDLLDWKKDSLIVKEKEENVMVIEKKNGSFNFYVNGKKIYETPVSNIKMTGKNFGIVLYGQKQVRVKHIKARGTYRRLNLIPNAVKGYKHENLGPNINTEFNEKVPVIAPDGRTIYFCNDHNDGKGDDVWFSILGSNGWEKAQSMGTPINNINSNALMSVSADNNIIYLLHKYKADGTFGGRGISYAVRTANGWSVPKDIVIDNLTNEHKRVVHYFSQDTKYMLSALQTKESYGDSDIYVSFKKSDGSYTEPMNIGYIINTNGAETTPFLASDNKTMYFSSDGHAGYGSNDIFVTHRLDDTWKNWSEPQNLGPEINTDDWDAYFTLSASGEEAYLVTSKNTLGKSDIVKVKLSEQARPKPVVLVSGKVLNKKTNEPLSANIKYFDLQTNEDAGGAISNPSTGEYNIILQAGKKYGFRAEKEQFYAVNDMLDVTNLTSYKEIRKDLFLVPIEVGQSIRLNNVFFDFNKYELKPESFSELDRLVDFLKQNLNMEIELGGHTDNVGNEDYNNKLSQQRTESVVNYLVSKGIQKSRLQAKGYGKSKPIATNDTEEGRSINRRVEFTIIKQ